MVIDLNYRVDILKGIVSQNAEHPLYYDDQNAHRVNVSLYRGQDEIDLSGLSCNGYVVFVKEGTSIGPLTGEVSNNTCSVVLPHEAYQHPGAIRVEIKLIEGDSVTTVLMLTGHVSSGRGDHVIDITGSIVPSLDSLKATIEELERRIAAIEVSDVVELGRKVDLMHIVEEGYPVTAYGADYSTTSYGVTYTKIGNRLTLNGTNNFGGSAYRYYAFGTGSPLFSGTTGWAGVTDAYLNTGFVLKAGVTYNLIMRALSGSTTSPGTAARLQFYYKNADGTGSIEGSSVMTVGSTFSQEQVWTYTPSADKILGYGLIMYPKIVFSNLVIEYAVVETIVDTEARVWTGAMPKLSNILWDGQNVMGKHTDTTRNRVVEIDRNMVRYTRTGASTAGQAYVLTGSTFRNFPPNSSYRVTTSMTEEADFIPLPVPIADTNASRVYLWVYSPDNASCTTSDSTNPGYTQNRLLFATRDTEGNVWFDASGDGVTISQSHNGVYIVRLDTEFSSLWSHMISDGTLAVYYICRINNSGLDGTMYWGIGISLLPM